MRMSVSGEPPSPQAMMLARLRKSCRLHGTCRRGAGALGADGVTGVGAAVRRARGGRVVSPYVSDGEGSRQRRRSIPTSAGLHTNHLARSGLSPCECVAFAPIGLATRAIYRCCAEPGNDISAHLNVRICLGCGNHRPAIGSEGCYQHVLADNSR